MNKINTKIIFTALCVGVMIFVGGTFAYKKINTEKRTENIVEYMNVGIDSDNENFAKYVLQDELKEYWLEGNNVGWSVNFHFTQEEADTKGYFIGLKNKKWLLIMFDRKDSELINKIAGERYKQNEILELNIRGIEKPKEIDIKYEFYKETEEGEKEVVKEGTLSYTISKVDILDIN